MSGQYAQAQKSMEDILSSIRETIEEDIKEGRRWTNTPFGPAISPAPSTDSSVLDLTQLVNDDGSLTTLTPSSFTEAAPSGSKNTFVQENTQTPNLFLVEEDTRRTTVFGKKEPEYEPTFSPLTPENVMIFPAFQAQGDLENVPSFESQNPVSNIDSHSFQEVSDQNQPLQTPYISLQTPTPKQDFYYVAPEDQMSQMQEPAFTQPYEEAPIMQSSPSKAEVPEILLNAEIEVNSIQRALEEEVCEEEQAQESLQDESAEVQEEVIAQEELPTQEEMSEVQEEMSAVQEEVFVEASADTDAAVDTLMSQETVEASSQALSALARSVIEQKMQQKELTPTEKFGQQTVDELMQAILRPMLKEWLDAHLPSLVKWIVTEQIEKVMQQGLSSDKSTS